VGLFDYLVFLWAIFLIVLGLIFVASGFGVFVSGRLDGFIFVIIGVAMFWGGWVLSGARGFSCAVAAVLNMFDAASTVAFWSFEINPFVLAAGPTIFMSAKVACSLAITVYAKMHPHPSRGGVLLAAFFAVIVGWNLSQYMLAYLGLVESVYGIFVGTFLSFSAVVIVIFILFKSRTSARGS
jgi:hypothetical protein